MNALSELSDLVEKERISLHLNAQVEEFLRGGGAIEVVTGNVRPSTEEDAGSAWDDEEELTPDSD